MYMLGDKFHNLEHFACGESGYLKQINRIQSTLFDAFLKTEEIEPKKSWRPEALLNWRAYYTRC